jgi:predicted permease
MIMILLLTFAMLLSVTINSFRHPQFTQLFFQQQELMWVPRLIISLDRMVVKIQTTFAITTLESFKLNIESLTEDAGYVQFLIDKLCAN